MAGEQFPARPGSPGSRRLSRRLFLGGAGAATAAGLGALALERARRSGEPPTAATDGARPADDPRGPLADPQLRAAHLLRRAGFGPTPDEVAAFAPLSVEEAADRLLAFDAVSDDDLAARAPKPEGESPRPQELARWWLLRMIHTPRPLQERMTLFWHGLLTSSLNKVGARRSGLLLAQNEFLRAHAVGSFRDILTGISRDPAMLLYLDGDGSAKAHPNENYARELMELFSLGIGHYTETDVREAARAFTGWQVTRAGEAVFRPERWDEGSKTVVGATGAFRGDDVVDVILRQPATATYLPGRLWGFFAYPDPEPDLLARLGQNFVASGFSVRALLRAVLTAPEFYSHRAYRALVKSPVELVAGAARQLGLGGAGEGFAEACAQMGQQLFNPPSVAGWPGGPAWLSSATWFARVNFFNGLLDGPGRFAAGRADSAREQPPSRSSRPPHLEAPYHRLAAILAAEGLTTGAGAVTYFAGLLVDGRLSDAALAELTRYVDGDGGELAPAAPEERVERAAGLVYLLLASPEYQLA